MDWIKERIADSVEREPVVIVMAKAPREGRVKTRLCPPLLPSEAAALAAAFLKDVVTNATSCARSVLLSHAPADGREEMKALLSADQLTSNLLWTPQQGDDLGARMGNAMEEAALRGFGPLVMIGTDSPTLPSAILKQAFALLIADEAECVLGPTADGGYYLIGLQQPVPGLFDAVAWSTSRALADTMHNALAPAYGSRNCRPGTM